ncbi:MFS transporter [Lentzea sp. NPDC060358]|uniref:MFS transporter n=1 Tax=Lentzea sp. NPDC060358 TaxID=3347103 RepID=UPI003668756A
MLLLAVDGTVLYLAVPSLTADLAPSSTQVLWIGDVYALALAGLLVTTGTLADRLGRKRVLLVGTAAFGAASALAAFAPNAEMLIAARLLLGVAGATIMPSTLSIIRNMFPDPVERTRAIAIWSAASAGGMALGPLVGGLLLERFWWGSVFLINVPVVLVFLVAGAVLLPESRNPRPGRFDLLSAAMSMIAIVPLVYAVKHTIGSGADLQTVLATAAGVTAGVLFVRRQRRLKTPLIDVELFANKAFSGAVLANFVAIFALMGVLFFFSQYLQLVRGLRPLAAGLVELPTTAASILAVAVVGVLVARLGTGRAVAVGLLFAALGLVLVAVAEDAGTVLWLAVALLPLGLGIGVAMTLTTDAVISAVPSDRAGAASAISETAFELGGALGIALLGSTVTLVYRASLDLPADLPGSARAAVEDSLATAVNAARDSSGVVEAAREAFTTAMQVTSVAAAAITVIAALIAWRTIPSGRKSGTTTTQNEE